MSSRFSQALEPYSRAFRERERPFLYYYGIEPERPTRLVYTRQDFWRLSTRAAGVLRAFGLKKGDAHLHCFSGNRPEDLAFRLGAAMVGTVPVTVNWQADGPDRIRLKQEMAACRLVIADRGFDAKSIEWRDQRVRLFDAETTGERPPLTPDHWDPTLDIDDRKIIIFTSGTTGTPKGVCHGYRGFETNRKTFDSFLGLGPEQRFRVVVVNPLHHANATAITDWSLRHPGAELHLIERYSTQFWKILTDLVHRGEGPIVVPLTARHFDFLANLAVENTLPVPLDVLQDALAQVLFLLGSAPVGPTTVARLLKYSGRTPVVRFGSTETCLQVMGIPPQMTENEKMAAFRRGWTFEDGARPGYFIGRPHPPHTEVQVVASIRRGDPAFMQARAEGVAGYLVTRGENLMRGYLNQEQATVDVFADGWYTGLLDVGFYLINPSDGKRDFYWIGRDSALLIRGGANYAYDQINGELADAVKQASGLSDSDFELAVVGLRLESEHEDACCLTLALLTERAKKNQDAILAALRNLQNKIARPDYIRLADVPRNFKGAVEIPRLKEAFSDWFASRNRSKP